MRDFFFERVCSFLLFQKYIDENGKLHLEQASLAAYAHGEYFALGKKIGSFGYSVRKKRTRKPRK